MIMAFSNGFTRLFLVAMMVAVAGFDALAAPQQKQYEHEPVLPDLFSTGQSCEPIDPDSVCGTQIPYKMTTFPNLLKQDAEEAKVALFGYRDLLHQNRSEHLHFFLCSVYMPMCTVVPPNSVVVVPPCRSVCLHVQERCEPVLREVGYSWPEALSCDKFPERNGQDGAMCMPGSVAELDPPTTFPAIADVTLHPARSKNSSTFECDDGYMPFGNASHKCIQSCSITGDRLESDARFAEIIHGVLAGFTWLLAVTVLIFHGCCSVRLTEAEKPIFCLLICYMMLAGGYILRLVSGRSIGCGPDGELVGDTNEYGLPISGCIIVFILLYYFGIAGHVWWLILAFTWFQQVVQRKSPECVARTVKVSYVFGFIVPLLPMALAFATHAVDADRLMAVCYVGQQNSSNLLYFVLAPLGGIVLVGTILLLTGFVKLRTRSKPTHSTEKQLEPFLAKQASCESDPHYLGLCVAMYLLSAFMVVGCHFYDFFHRLDKPTIAVYGLRIFFQFIYGIAVAIWLGWNSRCSKSVKTDGFYPSNLMNKPATKAPSGYSEYAYGSKSSSGNGHVYSSVGPLSPRTFQSSSMTREHVFKAPFSSPTARNKHSFPGSNPETFV